MIWKRPVIRRRDPPPLRIPDSAAPKGKNAQPCVHMQIGPGQRVYIMGLQWLLAPAAAKGAAGAVEMARRPDLAADLYAIHNLRYFEQFGLGWVSPQDSRRPKRFQRWEAAAVALARSVEASKWIGIWPLGGKDGDGKWWFVGVNADELLADGDTILESEDDAIDRVIAEMRNLGDDTLCFAPDDMAIPNSRNSRWQDLLTTSGSSVHAVPTVNSMARRQWAMGLAVVSGLVALAIGLWWLNRPVPPVAPPPLASRMNGSSLATVKVLPPPSAAQPKASAWIAGCMRDLGRLVQAAPGWTATRLSCRAVGKTSSDHVQVNYSANKNAMPDWLIRTGLPVDPTGHSVSLTVSRIPPRPHEALWPEAAVLRWSNQLQNDSGLTVRITGIRSMTPSFNNFRSSYHKVMFKVVLPMSPTTVSSVFDQVPGLVITSISSAIDKAMLSPWVVEGHVYAVR